MLLLVCAAVLGADLPAVFPPRSLKTRLYGTSLMDVGVGVLVYGQGLVALWRRPGGAFAAAAVLAALGVLRLLALHLTGLQQPPEEYGVHWNFFITLAVIEGVGNPVLQRLRVCGRGAAPTAVALALTTLLLYEHQLQHNGLAAYIAKAPRSSSLLSANREGLLSLCGHFALYLFAAATSLWRPAGPSRAIVAVTYGVACATSWTLTGPPSRRMVSWGWELESAH